ncbi:transthyretin-like family domain-containing protein [Ditylenchus destructor]|uniref:Transthyretin-like family domain-containing protein n=1 Tax=Ditylenchus destructor TaxID=166010 RepID=A0AAD4QVL2_9BILA|nr:transthyretin-like family domain-containing protein [Ditylenchus destructor]
MSMTSSLCLLILVIVMAGGSDAGSHWYDLTAQLVCNEKPIADKIVELYDRDWASADDLLAVRKTNSTGKSDLN